MKTRMDFGALIRRFLAAWIVAVTVEYLLLTFSLRNLSNLDGLAQMSLMRIFIVSAFLFVLLRFIPNSRFHRWLMVGAFAVLALTSLCANFSWAFLCLCGLILVILVAFAEYGWDETAIIKAKPKEENRVFFWLTVVLTVFFFLFVSIWTVCRVLSFSTPTYDFGIFAQMFHSMKTTWLPMTTVERDGVLSHFAVHMSPIYYLLLPFYCLAPNPATLQVLQAAVMASAVIPLWKLGKYHGLGRAQRILLCAMLLLYPAFVGSAGYDIHENCFLTPLILWLFYGLDRNNIHITAVSAVMTLMVKEDAAVYVAVVGLWLLVSALLHRKKWGVIAGITLLACAVAYFFAVTTYLATQGDGVMTYRYDNFIYDSSGSLITVIKSVLLCPMKALYECMDAEKLEYIALTMLPLLGMPFLTRRYDRYILLIPYILVNLMSDYSYQHDVFFQYNFGSVACLFYMALVNLADLKNERLRMTAMVAAVMIGSVCFGSVVVPKAMQYPLKYVVNHEEYEQIRAALDQIPEEASVTASTFYSTYLSQREILYDVRYSSEEHLLSTEYVVIVPSGGDFF